MHANSDSNKTLFLPLSSSSKGYNRGKGEEKDPESQSKLYKNPDENATAENPPNPLFLSLQWN